jgi:hypothetical protein
MTFNRVAATIFALVAVGHAYRAVQQLPFQIGSIAVPEWASLVGAGIAGALSVWGFRARS